MWVCGVVAREEKAAPLRSRLFLLQFYSTVTQLDERIAAPRGPNTA